MPLVVVECKSPSVPEPLSEAVDQLRRYSNQRKAAFEIDDNEGNEALFATNQLLVATSFDEARVGCVGAAFEHYAQWKTVVPGWHAEARSRWRRPGQVGPVGAGAPDRRPADAGEPAGRGEELPALHAGGGQTIKWSAATSSTGP
jgi:hypothetical protein